MKTTQLFTQFREQVYQNFNKRADSLMELVDALSSNQHAQSVAELSLEDCFRREYSALYKGLAACTLSDAELAHLAGPYLPVPQARNFWTLAIDVSAHPRVYAKTLQDRGCVYTPTVIAGNKPITLGHQYSTVVALPEKTNGDPAWVIPLSAARVTSQDDKELRGAEQVRALLEDPQMPFHGELCVGVHDSSYSKPAYLYAHHDWPNWVDITRVRSNRVFYRQYEPAPDAPPAPGHPRWYGARFALREEETGDAPDETQRCTLHKQNGQTYQAEIQVWHNLVLRGKRKPSRLPMHECPFTLVRVQLYRADGTVVYRRALWFIIYGERRAEVDPVTAYCVYDQRFDTEHTFRFCKQRLLLTAYQTPEVQREESWWRLVYLAYLQLWVARDYAERLPRPWERYLPTMQAQAPLTPTLVQRDLPRIIRAFGTPARPAKRRGYSPGRAAGTVRPQRERQPVVVKSKKQPAAAATA